MCAVLVTPLCLRFHAWQFMPNYQYLCDFSVPSRTPNLEPGRAELESVPTRPTPNSRTKNIPSEIFFRTFGKREIFRQIFAGNIYFM